MSEKEKKKQIAKISVFITSLFVIFLSVTYAFINMTLVGTRRQVITAGNLELELLEDENNLTIQDAMPMYDEVGMVQEAFTFRLKNKTTTDTNYILRLVDITTGEKLDTNIVKYGLTKDGTSTIKLLSTLKNGEIDKGKISGNQTINYSLRLWIDSSVEENTVISGKNLSYRIDVEVSQDIEISYVGMIRPTRLNYIDGSGRPHCSAGFDDYCDYILSISSVVFENKIAIPDGIAEDQKFDLSVLNDESVMGYLEESGANYNYRLHIQGNGKIYANTDSSGMFASMMLDEIEGLEYLDTSKVNNMYEMFYGYSGDQLLNLSGFDTSNVTNMSCMFSNYRSSQPLDLSSFNTSNVTNMSRMFSNYSSNQPLDLSSFNTSKVTDMFSMFSSYSSNQPLDLSNFNTSNVIDMSSMFSGCNNLTNLNLSNFNVSNVTNMSRMFYSIKNDCLITVKDEAMKAWVLEQNNELTNVVVNNIS